MIRVHAAVERNTNTAAEEMRKQPDVEYIIVLGAHGSSVYVDGTLRTRKYRETYKCKECGEEFDVPGRTIDVLSHDTEYLRDCDVDKLE